MKRFISVLLTLIIIFGILCITPLPISAIAPTADYTWYGDGSATTFTLSDASDLLGFANLTNGADGKTRTDFAGKTVELAADIKLNEGNAANWATTPPDFTWPTISYCTSDAEAKTNGFNGVFDGKSHKISGVYINASSGYAGFFSSVANDTNTAGPGVVKNLYVVNSYIKGSGTSGTAGVAGYVYGRCTVDNVYCDAIIDSTATTGGIVGRHNNSNYVLTISNCVFAGTINSTSSSNNAGMLGYAGGDSSRVSISGCINLGTISGKTHIAGITAGNSRPDAANITDCLNMGTVSGTQYIGGIATGKSYDVADCINVGNITATLAGAVGSIYGTQYVGTSPTVSNCYYTVLDRAMASGSANKNEDSSACVTNTKKVTEQFLKTSFVDANYTAWTVSDGEIPMPASAKKLMNSYRMIAHTGASVRLSNPTGLRFSGSVLISAIEKYRAEADSVTFGMIIAPLDYITGEFTVNALNAASKKYLEIEAVTKTEKDGYYVFNAVIANVKESNYDRAFAAITYIKVVDGSNTTYIYSDYVPENNTRSISSVAQAAFKDTSTTQNSEYCYMVTAGIYSRFTIEQLEILLEFFPLVITESLRLMTYNIRSIQMEDVPPLNLWQRPTYEDRNPQGVVNTIIAQSPDVVGLQEVNFRTESSTTKNWFNDYLNALTENGYTLVKGSKNGDNSYNPVFYKTSRFELVSTGTYWLTSTPTVVSSVSGSDYDRFMTWVFLRDKVTGVVFMFVNTHLENGSDKEAVRQTQAQYLVQYIKELNTDNVPVFISGDFNSKYSSQTASLSAAAKVIIDDPLWKDARKTAVTRVNDVGSEAAGFTFDGRAFPIDLMFVPENNCVIDRYEVVNNYDAGSLTDSSDLFSGKYPSDHLPVMIDVSLSVTINN